MRYESATLRTAFCILPQNTDDHLSFYTDVLGLQVIRHDESFRRFNTQPAIVCLWEIGHVSRHLGFANHATSAVTAKAIVFLEVPTLEAADVMQAGCRARGLTTLRPLLVPPETKGFTVRDPNDCFWTVTVRSSAGPAQVPRFGVLAEDFEASVAFYRDVMRLKPASIGPDSARFATSDVVEIEVVRRSSVPGVEPLTEEQRQAHLTMPALGYHTQEEVDGVATRLRQAGAKLTADPVVHEWNFYVSYFLDPDANIWEVFTPTADGK